MFIAQQEFTFLSTLYKPGDEVKNPTTRMLEIGIVKEVQEVQEVKETKKGSKRSQKNDPEVILQEISQESLEVTVE